MFAFAQAWGIPRFCRNMVKSMALVLCACACLFDSGTLWAAASCTITSTSVAFGAYDPLDVTNTTSTGTLTFQCTTGVPAGGVTYKITLNQGSSGSYTPRTMKSGTNILDYNLYTTAALTIIWGDGTTAGTAAVSATITKTQATTGVKITVYGNIPAEQNVVVGAYTDSITATVTF